MKAIGEPMMNISVIEIRNYVLQPHMTQHFIDNFEANFITTLEAEGMAVLGQFRAMDAPDRFVWLRGYPNMEARRVSLHAFYDGPVWQRFRTFTNSMLVDSDHVHLLRPVGDISGLTAGLTAQFVAQGLSEASLSPKTGLVAIDYYRSVTGQRDAMVEQVLTAYQHAGIPVRGAFVAETEPNNFPRHPALQDPDLLAVITAFDWDECGQHAELPHVIAAELGGLLAGSPETLLLEPTLRSALRYMGK